MNSSVPKNLSLYELALRYHRPPTLVQIGPASFKSALAGLFDLLIDQQIAATIWVKLPTNPEWQTDLIRYRDSKISGDIYLCQIPQSEADKQSNDTVLSLEFGPDRPAKKMQQQERISWRTHHEKTFFSKDEYSTAAQQNRDVYPSPNVIFTIASPTIEHAASDLPSEYGIAPAKSEETQASSDFATAIYPLKISTEASLKREYFVIAISESFSAGMVAHQPRTVRKQERQPLLLALCSFDRQLLNNLLLALQKVIPSQTKPFPIPISKSSSSEVAGVADQNFYAAQLWAKQISRYEELGRTITNYHQQTAELAARELQNQELLEAIQLKDEFLNNVGQALRTPLTNMKTALTLLNSPNLKAEQRKRYMQLLHRECDRQSSLINGLLDLVQLDHLVDQTAEEPLPLADIVPGVVSTYQPLAQEKGVMLAYTVPEDLPPVCCLRAWLKQIVINLLHNGIKFTPAGGQVWVKAKQQGDYIQLQFKDTGIGIPAGEVHKIFDRFYRVRQAVDEDPGGAGLGLTIVQQLLLRCGGSISVKSKLGEGSVFNVLLPIYRE